MSSAVTPQPHEGFVHEAVYFASAEQLVETAAPLLRRALADGGDVALVCSDAHNAALMEALGHDPRVEVLPRPEIYTKAVTAVAFFRDFVQERVTGGAERVCVLGEVGFPSTSRAWAEWRRYEALLDHALGLFPLWCLCGYDTGVLADPVITTADETHSLVRRGAVRSPNPAHVDPTEVLRLADATAPLVRDEAPGLVIPDLVDLSDLHRKVTAFLAHAVRDRGLADDFLMAVHEVAINGLRHGKAPVTVRFWAAPGQVECTVTDRGHGFDDPFVGYVRGGGEELPEGRFGLWLARQMCDEVVVGWTPEGFTIRLALDL